MKIVADNCEKDVNNVLLLLLGCAVHGEQRDKFIERIKRMENELQTALINQIKKVVVKFCLHCIIYFCVRHCVRHSILIKIIIKNLKASRIGQIQEMFMFIVE